MKEKFVNKLNMVFLVIALTTLGILMILALISSVIMNFLIIFGR